MTNKTSEFAIALEPAESESLNGIETDVRRLRSETAQANGLRVVELMHHLIKRGAIPKSRISYWRDPEYSHGHTKDSHEGSFLRNGCKGDEIFKYPHFLQYLSYFLFGADLPSNVITAFKEKIGNPEWQTSGDIIPLAKYAKTLARNNGLDRTNAEEFFKLAIDIGLPLYNANVIRKSVSEIK